MPKFVVDLHTTHTASHEIEAETAEEAITLVREGRTANLPSPTLKTKVRIVATPQQKRLKDAG